MRQIDARFRISGPAGGFPAGRLCQGADPFRFIFSTGRQMFLSTLLDAQADNKQLIFDCSGSQETNRRVLAAEKISFSGRPGGVPASAGAVREVSFEGSKALSSPCRSLSSDFSAAAISVSRRRGLMRSGSPVRLMANCSNWPPTTFPFPASASMRRTLPAGSGDWHRAAELPLCAARRSRSSFSATVPVYFEYTSRSGAVFCASAGSSRICRR